MQHEKRKAAAAAAAAVQGVFGLLSSYCKKTRNADTAIFREKAEGRRFCGVWLISGSGRGCIMSQPLHCAHVADFYAEKQDRVSAGSTAHYLRSWVTDSGIKIGGAGAVVWAAEAALNCAKRAAREWVRAGGAA